MVKPLYIGIAVLLLFVIGGGAMVLSNRNSSEVTTETTVGTTTPVNQSAEAPRTIKELLTYTGTQQCSFSTEGNTGTVYMSGGRMRADFTVTVNSSNTDSHMIMDGQTVYIWTEGQSNGFKIMTSVAGEFEAESQTAAIDPNKDMNFTCSSWIANQSVFTPPTNITFTDFDASLKVDGNAPAAISCSTCDSMPESARADCRAALCN